MGKLLKAKRRFLLICLTSEEFNAVETEMCKKKKNAEDDENEEKLRVRFDQNIYE